MYSKFLVASGKKTVVIACRLTKKLRLCFLPKQRYYFLLTVTRFFIVKVIKTFYFVRPFSFSQCD